MRRNQRIVCVLSLILACILLLTGCVRWTLQNDTHSESKNGMLETGIVPDPESPAADIKEQDSAEADSDEADTVSSEEEAEPDETEPVSPSDVSEPASEVKEQDSAEADSDEADTVSSEEEARPDETEPVSPPDGSEAGTQDEEPAAPLDYADLSGLAFEFASGVGAWSTELTIESDGSFTGSFHDADMGDTGEGYPNGTIYYCDFSGHFGPLRYVDDYTGAAEILDIGSQTEPDTEELAKDGIRYISSYPYGLEDAETIYFYLPGKLVEELPEGFRDWCWYRLDECENGKLNFYGLYNEAMEEGFTSFDPSTFPTEQELILERYEEVSARSNEIDSELEKANLTQQSMNTLEDEDFENWDQLLNRIWSWLKETLDADAMKALKEEELQWIAEKEAAAAEAGAEFEDGSLQHFAMTAEATRWTKERVTVLIDRYLRG